MTKAMILKALKQLKEGDSIDLLALPDLTSEELAAFKSRNTQAILEKMLRQQGITAEDESDSSDESSHVAESLGQ
jgi:hypothetical protein